MLRSACAMLKPVALETVPRRFRRRKILTWPVEYLPFEWTYPAKLDLLKNSGDKITGIPNLDRERLVGAFANLPELKNAPEAVKRVFSIDFAPKEAIKKTSKEDLIKLLRRHPCDTSSLEYRIACRTFRIRLLREQFTGNNTRNKEMKDCFNSTVQIRNKYLSRLGRQDQRRYQFVKEVLEIDHTPFPVGEGHKKITRKGELRRLTQEYADNVKEEKLQAYHEKLKVLQKSFESEKKETEEWIANEIKALKLTEEELHQLEHKSILE